MVEGENQIQQPQNELKVQKTSKVWIWGGIVFALYMAVMVLIALNVDSFTLTPMFIFIILGAIIYGGIAFGFKYLHKFMSNINKDEEKKSLPPARPIEELKKKAKKMMEQQEYLFRIEEVLQNGSDTVGGDAGKSDVYTLYVKTQKSTYLAVIINQHYPDTKFKIVHQDSAISPEKLSSLKKSVGSFAEEKPNIEESVETNPLLGTEKKTRKVSKPERNKQEPRKQEKQGGDLS